MRDTTLVHTPNLDIKQSILRENLSNLMREGLVLAFSGGVDSSYLLWEASQICKRLEKEGAPHRLVALTTTSESLAEWERQEAIQFAQSLGVTHVLVKSHEVSQDEYAKNDGSRCYYCKSELFKICHDESKKRNYSHIAYGYNESDKSDHRPGHKAALEQGICSPLADAQLTKNDIRELLKRSGLHLSEKPASPCLASRIMVGTTVTPARLRHIEEMESILRGAGLRVFRVRLHEEGNKSYLRIETAPEEMEAAFRLRRELSDEGKKRGYAWVTLDLSGYQGISL